MTDSEILKQYNVKLIIFKKDLWDRKGFCLKQNRTIFVNEILSNEERHKVILHELKHFNHDPTQYQRRHEEYELQANRSMIHHLLSEELKLYDNFNEFNYIQFMKKHGLKTITDEIMVIDEYYNLIS